MQDVFFFFSGITKQSFNVSLGLSFPKQIVGIHEELLQKKKKRKVLDNVKQKVRLITDCIDSKMSLALIFSMYCESECSNIL